MSGGMKSSWWLEERGIRWLAAQLGSMAGPTVTSPSPLLLFVFPPHPPGRKKRSRPSSFHEPSSQPPSGETTRWLCPLLRASGLLEPFVGRGRDTWTPHTAYLLLRHLEVIQRVSSISRRSRGEENRLTTSRRLSCYGRPTVDSRLKARKIPSSWVSSYDASRHDAVFISHFI